MSWRIAIRHTTAHHYAQEVSASYNEARVIPMTLPRQTCLEARVDTEPGTRLFRYTDYWGTNVAAFDFHLPHTEMVVHGSSLVETSPAARGPDPIAWTDLDRDDVRDGFAELLQPTGYVPAAIDQLTAVAEEARRLPDPAAAAHTVMDWVHSNLRYRPGATDVSTSATEAVTRAEGVCQDFAHVSLVLLRNLGIPARYVSGYLHPSADASVGDTILGQSHAWVEWWCGDWSPWDPTHAIAPGERHVVLARGRDYADVAPLKGIYHGALPAALEVTVELTRTG
jgi:transglutaminase-like putative cysteine protease